MKPIVSIVVVTWRAAETVARCLSSLRRASRTDAVLVCSELIVVDNASGDGTAERIRRDYPEARVIARKTNGGFSVGVNAGVREARGDYVLVLNPDCVLGGASSSARAITELVKHLDQRPWVAAVGPGIVDEEGLVAPNGRSFPTPLIELRRQLGRLWPKSWRLKERSGSRRNVDWVSGACMLIRREALREVGAFDESFFLYWEETDWCRRATAFDWEIHFRPDVRVLHSGGVSAAQAGVIAGNGCLPHHFRSSRRRYYRKHHGPVAALVVDAVHAIRRLCNLGREMILASRSLLELSR